MSNTNGKSANKKPKLVRDSFTIPKAEFAAIDQLKTRAIGLGLSIKKSELLRAGLMALTALSDAAYLKAIQAVPTLKTGRPSAPEAQPKAPAPKAAATPKKAEPKAAAPKTAQKPTAKPVVKPAAAPKAAAKPAAKAVVKPVVKAAPARKPAPAKSTTSAAPAVAPAAAPAPASRA